MKKYKVKGRRVQPFSGIIETDNINEILNDKNLMEKYITNGNL